MNFLLQFNHPCLPDHHPPPEIPVRLHHRNVDKPRHRLLSKFGLVSFFLFLHQEVIALLGLPCHFRQRRQYSVLLYFRYRYGEIVFFLFFFSSSTLTLSSLSVHTQLAQLPSQFMSSFVSQISVIKCSKKGFL